MVNPFTRKGKWYKANLHTHTTVSDGKLTPAERVEQYRKAGYHVLAMTDHHVTQDVRGLSSKTMLVVSGIEFHPPCRRENTSHHFVGLGVPHGLKFSRPKNANRCIEDIHQAGGIVILAHPFWTGIEWSTIRTLRGLDAVEVYNTCCEKIGRAASENEWSYMLDHGMAIPAVATDDVHVADGPLVCDSATWLKMPALTVANVLKAVRTGCCYSTHGPKIHDFRVEKGKVKVRCSPARAIHIMSRPAKGGKFVPSGKTITSMTVDVDPQWPYIRAVVTDHQGRKAWTNPIALP
ncbi:MAG: CehA/McbA family metallohydrolase [Phycisphaerae bacterium]|nr:CehA/McbA family metallohydrolase [Phycisphaerae bacterium]